MDIVTPRYERGDGPGGPETAFVIHRDVASVILRLKHYYSTRNYTQVVHFTDRFPKKKWAKVFFSFSKKNLKFK
jgi:hypothetical protein